MNTIRTMRFDFQCQVKTLSKATLLFAATSIFSGSAAAHCISEKLYAGAGLTFNSLDNYENDARGFQLFGGYCLDVHKQLPHNISSIELGYMDSGNFRRDVLVRQGRNTIQTTQSTSYEGLWVNLVGEYKLDPRVHLLGRIGVDGGDDDGVMAGFGIGLNFSKWAQFRIEYVARDHVNSTQINWLTGF
ncbi:MAG: hypothetical protein HY273_15150 [Gammaproteobacteria bacterium]|nr:hypothetical protein [Gammaproteobacteria bacterium]